MLSQNWLNLTVSLRTEVVKLFSRRFAPLKQLSNFGSIAPQDFGQGRPISQAGLASHKVAKLFAARSAANKAYLLGCLIGLGSGAQRRIHSLFLLSLHMSR